MRLGFATLKFLPNKTVVNRRVCRQALVDIYGESKENWLGGFVVFGKYRSDIEEKAYSEASARLKAHGFKFNYMAKVNDCL